MELTVTEVASGVWQCRTKLVCWVLVREGDEVTLVDSGYPGDRARVIASLERIGRSPADVAAVVLTHAHADHKGNAENFRIAHHTPVLVHDQERDNATGARIEQITPATLLKMAWRPSVFVFAADLIRQRAAQVQHVKAPMTFAEGALDVPGRPIPIHTPGHTSGHCAMYLPERGVLLAGDALMTGHQVAEMSGPQLLPDPFNHDTAQARASLTRLADLPADFVVPGHGEAFRASPAQVVDAALAASPEPAPPGHTRLTYGTTLPLPPDEAFGFVCNPANWPTFFADVTDARGEADWGRVGGHARTTTSVMGRSVTTDLEITVWDPPRDFHYIARQSATPDLHHVRTFRPVPGGTQFRGRSQYVPRKGLARVTNPVTALVLQRIFDRAMAKLPEVAARSDG